MSQTLCSLRSNVHKVYHRGASRSTPAGITVDIPRRDFLALMGPSGSGKTTLLNLVGALDRPSEGAIEVGGNRIDQMSPRASARWRADHVGFIFQLYNLLPDADRRAQCRTAPALDEGDERQGTEGTCETRSRSWVCPIGRPLSASAVRRPGTARRRLRGRS